MSYVRKNNEKIGLKKYDYIIILKKKMICLHTIKIIISDQI